LAALKKQEGETIAGIGLRGCKVVSTKGTYLLAGGVSVVGGHFRPEAVAIVR
jgi:hypothetical protein